MGVMRRAGVLIAALLLVTATGASAKFGFGVRAGMGAAYANYQYNLAGVSSDSKNSGVALAAHAGLAVNIGFTHGFEVESGAQFALLGSRVKSENPFGDYTWNRSLYVVQIPVRAGWSYPFSDAIGIYAQLGPQFTVAVGGKDNRTGDIKLTKIKHEGEMTFGDDGQNNRFLMDLSIHAGVTLGGFRVGAYYDLGLMNMSSVKEIKYKPSSAGVSVAYFFGF